MFLTHWSKNVHRELLTVKILLTHCSFVSKLFTVSLFHLLYPAESLLWIFSAVTLGSALSIFSSSIRQIVTPIGVCRQNTIRCRHQCSIPHLAEAIMFFVLSRAQSSLELIHINLHCLFCSDQYHVFELTRQLPRFSMYILVTDTSSITKPDSGITFIVKERVQRVSHITRKVN